MNLIIKDNPSLIATNLVIMGNLKSKGSIEVEGIVTGDIEANSVSIREKGKIEGNIKANVLNIKGCFSGKAICDKINVSDSAKIDGELVYTSLAVDYGANINCQLTRNSSCENTNKINTKNDITKEANTKNDVIKELNKIQDIKEEKR